MKPRLLDLFCCEGGASEGYARAGFDVTGVDLNPQRRYPFEFHQADAIDYLSHHWQEFDAIHASPPCQAYSITKHSHDKQHPELIEPVREALKATGLPYIIENVPGAPLDNPITLCGTQFALTATDADGTPLVLRRHRLFESNVLLYPPAECQHKQYADQGYGVGGVYGGGSSDRGHAKNVRRGGYTPGKPVREALMGIDWMTLHGLSQSLPPVYTEFMWSQLLLHVQAEAAA